MSSDALALMLLSSGGPSCRSTPALVVFVAMLTSLWAEAGQASAGCWLAKLRADRRSRSRKTRIFLVGIPSHVDEGRVHGLISTRVRRCRPREFYGSTTAGLLSVRGRMLSELRRGTCVCVGCGLLSGFVGPPFSESSFERRLR